MTHYSRSGDIYSVAPDAALNLHAELPVGTYTAVQDPLSGEYLLKMAVDVTVPSKLYGDTTRLTDRILRTFLDRTNSTGVLLAGEKGSGKSLLAKNISVQAREAGIPTIIINSEFVGDGFNQFIQSIEQEVIILFDEFEKTYRREKQEALLTLFDGVFPTKKMFVLTVNDTYRIDTNITNRPGRMYYNIEFTGLTDEFVREYADELLNDKSKIDGLVAVSSIFTNFNFDMLKAMVEEMNRYDETALESARILNVKMRDAGIAEYSFRVFKDDTEYFTDTDRGARLRTNPFDSSFSCASSVWPEEDPLPEESHLETVEGAPLADWEKILQKSDKKLVRKRRRDSDSVYLIFGSEDFYGYDTATGILTFITNDGFTVTVKKETTVMRGNHMF